MKTFKFFSQISTSHSSEDSLNPVTLRRRLEAVRPILPISGLIVGSYENKAVFDELTDLISVPAEPSDPEEVGKAADVINDFLSKQSRSSRVLFLQRYYLGKGIREAAKCAGMTESGAKTRLSRMRAKLKVKLEEEGILL